MARRVVELSGFSDLEAKLKELPNNLARGAVRRAMVQAGNKMAQEQRDFAAEAGTIAETITVKVRVRSTAGFAEYAGALRDGGSYKDAQQALRDARRGGAEGQSRTTIIVGSTAPHAHLVEFGTVERFQKSGKSTGIMPMAPFIRPAWDAYAPGVVHDIKTALTTEIDKTSERYARKLAREK